MGPHTDFRPDPYQGDLLPILDTLKKGKRPGLSTADRERFLQEFEEENRYIAQEFLGNPDGRLFESLDDDQGDDEPKSLELENAFEIFAKIWMIANSNEAYSRMRDTIEINRR